MLIRTAPGSDLPALAAAVPGSTLAPTAQLTEQIATDMDTGAWLNELPRGRTKE